MGVGTVNAAIVDDLITVIVLKAMPNDAGHDCSPNLKN
jgi:hypothetical protein